MDLLGLGILLEFRDLASTRIRDVTRLFHQMEGEAHNLDDSLNNTMGTLSNLTVASGAMISAGKSVIGIGTRIAGSFKNVAKEVINTSDYFEKSTVTLNALYKDEAKASEVMNKAMALAAKTPFEVQDVTDAVIGFKALGVEALDTFTSANGQAQTLLEFVGDLASLRPDVGMQGILMGVRNLLGGDGGKSLQMRLDMDLLNFIGEDKWADTQEGMIQQLVDASSKVANGLMQKLEGTWSQIVSNLEDQKTRFLKAIGDNGAFDSAKKSLSRISEVIQAIDDAEMTKIGQGFAEAFNFAWKPVDMLATGVAKLVNGLRYIATEQPWIIKLVTGFLLLITTITILAGVFIVLKGLIKFVSASVSLFAFQLKRLAVDMGMPIAMSQHLGASLGFLLGKLLLLTAGIALAVFAWKTDFLGFRTTVENCIKGVKESIETYKRLMSFSDPVGLISNVKYLEQYGNVWEKLAVKAVKASKVIQFVKEAWNDFTLSDESFQVADELGILGIVTDILQAKRTFDSFVEGFKKGFSEFSDSCVEAFDNFKKGLEPFVDLDSITDKVKGFSESFNSVDTEKWESIGEKVGKVVGFLAGLKVIMVVGGIIAKVGGLLSTVFGVISGIASGVVTALAPVFAVIGAIVGIPAWLVAVIAVALGALIVFVVTHWEQVKQFFVTIGTSIAEFFSGLWDGMKTKASEFWTGLCQFASDTWDGVKKIWGTVVEFFSGIWDGIKQSAVSLFEWLGDKFSWVSDTISGIKDTIGGIIGGAVDWVTGKGKDNKKSNGKTDKMVGMSTGGYVKTTGIGLLHPNEVVVNAPLTQKLEEFLGNNHGVSLQKSADPFYVPSPTTTQSSNSGGENYQSTSSTVTFEKGAIQVTVTKASEEEAENFANLIMQKIKRKQELDAMKNYRPIGGV